MMSTSALSTFFALPANSSKATVSQYPTRPILPEVLFTKSFGTVTSPPEIRIPCGENSEKMCDLPVPLGPSSIRL